MADIVFTAELLIDMVIKLAVIYCYPLRKRQMNPEVY
jgi:hypothetical protein